MNSYKIEENDSMDGWYTVSKKIEYHEDEGHWGYVTCFYTDNETVYEIIKEAKRKITQPKTVYFSFER